MTNFKSIATLAAISAATIGFAGSVEAKQFHNWPPHHNHHDHGGYGVGAGIFGFAAGAMVGAALAQERYQEPNVMYVQPGSDWVSYCYAKHHSYNPATNMYVGYDGYYHQCR